MRFPLKMVAGLGRGEVPQQGSPKKDSIVPIGGEVILEVRYIALRT